MPGAPRVVLACVLGAALPGSGGDALATGTPSGCAGQVYLTLDTGSMRHAELIAGILRRHDVKATFFLANEKTPRGDFALDDAWAAFWRERVAEGHAFGSHTFDHVYFRGGPAGSGGDARVPVRPQFGERAGRTLQWSAADICAELQRVDRRFGELTGRRLDPLWRAPGGRAPDFAMRAASGCGYSHVHWAPAGFLGDELPSETAPNAQLLERALRDIRAGDVLMAHLGIWSRKDPFAPMLEPLIQGLKQRGLCFATLREHPQYRRRS